MAYMNGDEVLFSPQVHMNGTNIVVDTEMSDTSENPVQNKVVKGYVDNFVKQITEVAQAGFGELHALQDFVGNPIDLNLVTNGYFADGLTGWSEINPSNYKGYETIININGQPSLIDHGVDDTNSPLYQFVSVVPNKTHRVTVRMYGGGNGGKGVATGFVVADGSSENVLTEVNGYFNDIKGSLSTTEILCEKFLTEALTKDTVFTFEIVPKTNKIVIALRNMHIYDAGYSDITVTEIGRTITQDIYELKQMAVQIKKLLNIE